MVRLRWLYHSVFFILLATFPACHNTHHDHPNIIIISIDTLRADHVGAYGYPKKTTPNIDRVARTGAVFLHTFTTAPWTLPAHMSLFTGLPPSIHMVERQDTGLTKDIQTLPEFFKGKGYTTAGLITLPFVASHYGFGRGFDYFKEHLYKKSNLVTDDVLSWLSGNHERPFFLFIHYCDVHWPFAPPAKYARLFGVDTSKKRWHWPGKYRYLKQFIDPEVEMPKDVIKTVNALYDGELAHVDYNIGRIIDFLSTSGLNENTILVITSDHGEEFNEHHSFGHGYHFYSEVTRIPLVIHFPNMRNHGVRVPEAVSLIDLPITLINLAQVQAPPQFQQFAVDLSGCMDGSCGETGADRLVVMESMRAGPKCFGLVRNHFKYHFEHHLNIGGKNGKWVTIPESLFNIHHDMYDQKNLLKESPIEPLVEKNLVGIRSELLSYVNHYVSGLQLIFSQSEIGDNTQRVFSGRFSFDKPLDGYPFTINLTKEDAVVESSSGYRFNLAISPDLADKKIYLMVDRRTTKMEIKITHQGNILCSRTIPIPLRGSNISLYQDVAKKINISLTRGRNTNNPHKFHLREKHKNDLRSLGYIDQ